jgi:hypothetical protein
MKLTRRMWKDVCIKCVYTGLKNIVYIDYVIEYYVGPPMTLNRRLWNGVCMEYVYTGLQNSVYTDYVMQSHVGSSMKLIDACGRASVWIVFIQAWRMASIWTILYRVV